MPEAGGSRGRCRRTGPARRGGQLARAMRSAWATFTDAMSDSSLFPSKSLYSLNSPSSESVSPAAR